MDLPLPHICTSPGAGKSSGSGNFPFSSATPIARANLYNVTGKTLGSAEDSRHSNPGFALASCVTLRKSLNLSVALFPWM